MNRWLLSAVLALAASQVQAGWFDWLTGGDEEEAKPAAAAVTETAEPVVADTAAAAAGLLPSLTRQLGVTETQAAGGVGSLLQAAQGSLGKDDFAALSGYIPDAGTLMKAAPALGGSDSALGGLIKTAGQYGEAAKMASTVAAQFQALGLDPAMVGKFISVMQSFLQSSGGQAAVDLFSKGVAPLLG